MDLFVKVVGRAKVACYRFERAPNAVALHDETEAAPTIIAYLRMAQLYCTS